MRRWGWIAVTAGTLVLALVSLPLAKPQSGEGVVRFVYLNASAGAVYLVGDFNGWNPSATPLDEEDDGSWLAEVFLDPGTYEYKLLVDGVWQIDADNPELSASGNSIVRVTTGGTVLPPGLSVPTGDGPGASGDTSTASLRWLVRYLGFVTTRRDRALDRYDLDRPLHDIDLRLEAEFGPEASGWFLTNFNNLAEGTELSRAALRFDRGEMLWRPAPLELRIFDNTGVTTFEDPGALAGNVGIYHDDFGFGRRGAVIRRRFLGAPLEFLYADDTEPGADPVPALANVAMLLRPERVGTEVARYVTSSSDRNADALALRFRAGTAEQGLGVGVRRDRGASPGRLTRLVLASDAQGVFGTGLELETTESWSAWELDWRLQVRGASIIGEFMAGARQAQSLGSQAITQARADSSGAVTAVLGRATAADVDFDLDDSRRALVRIARSDRERVWFPALRYEYQETDFAALVTGEPFLMRRNTVGLDVDARVAGTKLRAALEQNWFEYPQGSAWETQFWFRQHNFWLDEDVAEYKRFTLLGNDRASTLELEAERLLWPARQLTGSYRLTYAAPGFDRSPRYLESVWRLSLPVWRDVELRTHSRLSSYRRFETADASVGALLGPGPHLEAGTLGARQFADERHDYRSFHAHFVELVVPFSDRSDVALGFGVDPIALYEVRNEYMDIGWDLFLFDAGASPAAAFTDPDRIGARIEAAERALERERRLTLEARVRF